MYLFMPWESILPAGVQKSDSFTLFKTGQMRESAPIFTPGANLRQIYARGLKKKERKRVPLVTLMKVADRILMKNAHYPRD